MFAKMINGVPDFLTLPVTIGGEKIYTNDAEILLRLGYKRYREEDRRFGPGAEAVRYEETEREIVRIIYTVGGDELV